MNVATLNSRDEELLALVESFEQCTVPKEQWNHRAHLVYALVMMLRHGADGGAKTIREGILRYNAALCVEQTMTGGYHESLTRFYIWVVQRFVETCDTRKSLGELSDELWAACGARDLPYRYYSRERLNSWAARTQWLEPDLQPLC
jgi:hypothetical protein